ncbi:MAG: PASTA domain-containing protein [Acidimicrobiales bacterium]
MTDQQRATIATGWVVKEAAPAFGLDDAGKAEVTFTVTNSGPVQDRAMFDIVPEGTADASWFLVDEPQRPVAPGDSAQYLVKVAVPAGATPGAYAIQGRAYSADRPPEESSVLSGRMAFEVAPPVKPASKPWWLIPIGVAVVAALAVVAFLVLRGDDVARGFTKGTTVPPLVVPDLSSLTEEAATAALEEAGLALGEVQHLHNPSAPPGQVTGQSIPANTEVESGTPVGLDVAITLAAPVLQSPGDGSAFATTTSPQPLTWAPVEGAADYSVVVQRAENFCLIPHDFDFNGLVHGVAPQQPPPPVIDDDVIAIDTPLVDVIDLIELCGTVTPIDSGTAPGTMFSPSINFTVEGTYQWRVAARDDAGTPGPASGFFQFTITTV